MKIKNFTDLTVWKESHVLVLSIYKATSTFPKKEKFGLISQMQRASISISSNIAEGFSRSTKKDKQRFYDMAKSSLTELQNQLLIARDLGFLERKIFFSLANQTKLVSRLITGLHRSAKSRRST